MSINKVMVGPAQGMKVRQITNPNLYVRYMFLVMDRMHPDAAQFEGILATASNSRITNDRVIYSVHDDKKNGLGFYVLCEGNTIAIGSNLSSSEKTTVPKPPQDGAIAVRNKFSVKAIDPKIGKMAKSLELFHIHRESTLSSILLCQMDDTPGEDTAYLISHDMERYYCVKGKYQLHFYVVPDRETPKDPQTDHRPAKTSNQRYKVRSTKR